MLPVFCLGKQFPASVRMKRDTLPTESSRASAVRFPFQPPMFSPPYFLLLRWSHYDYASELIFVFSDRDSIRACCGWLSFRAPTLFI